MSVHKQFSWCAALLIGGLSVHTGIAASTTSMQPYLNSHSVDTSAHDMVLTRRTDSSMVSGPADTVNVHVFLVRKEGTTMEEFKDHYESSHVPLIESLVFSEVQPLSYRRNYVNRTNTASLIGGFAPSWVHDCVTTVVCQDLAQRDALPRKFIEQNKAIAADEEKFLDRSKSLMILPSESLDTVPLA